MIFVTVGTHEQGLDRLIRRIDELKELGIITEEVFIQLGFSDYIPKHCKYKKMIGFSEMRKLVKDSRIIITHGGPGSIMLPWEFNKIPIVVPRNPEFNEHVDNHQILFTKRMEKESKIIAVYEIDDLEYKIINYYDIVAKKDVKFSNSTTEFNDKISSIIKKLL